MSMDLASDAPAPVINIGSDQVHGDPRARRGGRLRALDFCAGAVMVAGVLAVLANALVLQGTQPFSLLPQPRPSGLAGAPVSKAKSAGSTVIPLPAANPHPGQPGQAPSAGGATSGVLGYLSTKTSVSGVSTPLLPVSAEAAAAGAIASPRPVAGQRPPMGVGPAPEITGAVRPPADVPGSPRTLAVQRALAKLGYGPLKVDGVSGSETRLAIQRFQKDRKLPVDGEMSDRVVRELSVVSGMALN